MAVKNGGCATTELIYYFLMDERWEKLQRLFSEALALQGSDRAAFLERECEGDASMLAELEARLS